MLRAAGLRAMSVGNVGTPIPRRSWIPRRMTFSRWNSPAFNCTGRVDRRPRVGVPSTSRRTMSTGTGPWGGLSILAKGKVYERTGGRVHLQTTRTRRLGVSSRRRRSRGLSRHRFHLGVRACRCSASSMMSCRSCVRRGTPHLGRGTGHPDDVRGEAPTVAPHQVANALAAAARARPRHTADRGT